MLNIRAKLNAMLKNLFPCNLLAPGEAAESKFSVDQRVSPTANPGGRREQQKIVGSLCILSLLSMLIAIISCAPIIQVSRETTRTGPEFPLPLLWPRDPQEQVNREEKFKSFFCPTKNAYLLQKFCAKHHALHAMQGDGKQLMNDFGDLEGDRENSSLAEAE